MKIIRNLFDKQSKDHSPRSEDYDPPIQLSYKVPMNAELKKRQREEKLMKSFGITKEKTGTFID